MHKYKLMGLLLGAALFTGMGATSLSAEGMKCGAGKCGGAKKESMVKHSESNSTGAKVDLKQLEAKKAAVGKCGGK